MRRSAPGAKRIARPFLSFSSRRFLRPRPRSPASGPWPRPHSHGRLLRRLDALPGRGIAAASRSYLARASSTRSRIARRNWRRSTSSSRPKPRCAGPSRGISSSSTDREVASASHHGTRFRLSGSSSPPSAARSTPTFAVSSRISTAPCPSPATFPSSGSDAPHMAEMPPSSFISAPVMNGKLSSPRRDRARRWRCFGRLADAPHGHPGRASLAFRLDLAEGLTQRIKDGRVDEGRVDRVGADVELLLGAVQGDALGRKSSQTAALEAL